MGDFLLKALNSLPHAVQSPYAFIAYLAVIIAWVVIVWRVKRNRQLLKKVQSFPDEQKRDIILAEMGSPVPPKLSAEQWLKSRRQLYLFYGFIVSCIAAIVVVVAAVVQEPDVEATQIPNRAIQVKVFDFRNLSNSAERLQIGEKYSAHLLDTLFVAQANAGKGELTSSELAELINRFYLVPMRGPPPTTREFESLLSLAPVLVIYGWVDDTKVENEFAVRIRVSLITSTDRAFVPLAIDLRIINVAEMQVEAEDYGLQIASKIIPLAQRTEDAGYRARYRDW